MTYSNPWTNSAGIGTYTITRYGQESFTRTGANYRDSGGFLAPILDYTVTIGTDDLVVPIIKADSGFSGGTFGGEFRGTRYPFVATFGMLEAFQEVATY